MAWQLHGPFFMRPCVKLGSCTHDIERALSRAAPLCRLTVSCGFTSARTRIRWPFTCLVYVCHDDTRVPTEDTTSLQPSPSLQPSSEGPRGRIHEINVLLVWKSTFRHMYASTFVRLCTVWLDSETCSRARHGESKRGGRCSRLNEASSVLQESSPATFHCIGKLL